MGVDFDTVVIGAGVVGLAVAARLARRDRPLLIVERRDGILRETSSRSSEVVHAGLYYPPGSIKGRACVRGRELLYARCDRLGIAAPRVGKLLVAVDQSELSGLAELEIRARANGAPVQRIERAELRRRWPDVPGVAALHSPRSGIVDSHAYGAALLAEAEARGATALFDAEVVAGGGPALRLDIRDAGGVTSITARRVVNAAGLGQDAVSARAGLDVDALGYRQTRVKGEWFAIAPRHRGRAPCLLYPVGSASGGGLGVHLCLDVGGGMRLGPDATWPGDAPPSLTVDPHKAGAFLAAGQRLMPWLEAGDLTPDMAGFRPKLARPGEFADFVVAEESARGLPGWVTLAGIESPGLTAAEALAEEVERALQAVGLG